MEITANEEDFINYNQNIPSKKGLFIIWMSLIIISIPTAFLGAYSNITKITLLPITAGMSLYIIYLAIDFAKKKLQNIVFLGISSIYLSILFLIVAYKFAATAMNVPPLSVIFIIFAYLCYAILCILNTSRLIRKGYYNKQKKIKNSMVLYIVSGIFGISIGRIFLTGVDQETVVNIMIVSLLILSFLFLSGVHNFLKYYILKNQKNAR